MVMQRTQQITCACADRHAPPGVAIAGIVADDTAGEAAE
jgi:hypothetical protein